MIRIPKNLGHIWIGPNPAPTNWFKTWIDKHPDWNYRIYDNDFLKNFPFKNKKLIDFYLDLQWYAGAADLMRYEILYKFGGFIPGADSICYHNTEELFTESCAYTVYENEFIRGKLVSPILACEPNNPFVKKIIDKLSELKTEQLDDPWRTTGNLFVAQMIEQEKPNIIVFPSHYFIPVHYTGVVYKGDDKVYCKQLFGSTRNIYITDKTSNNPLHKYILYKINKLTTKKLRSQKNAILNKHEAIRLANFNKDF